ncbi:MAG: hypothetical protein M0024_12220 [Nitrospiraceae bacterium]|nr:hypothetical protein [Nitrospiraceae bacterium]
MKKTDYLIWLGVAAAAGTALGALSDRKKPGRGGIIGAAAAVVAGSVAAGVYQYVTSEKVPYYSTSSELYEEIEPV